MKTATVRLVFGVLMAAALATGCASSRYPANAKLKTGSGPLVQAHRGGRAEYDDNALGGFKMCRSRGIKGFELDVRYTKDCVLVVMHDESLDRTTNGKGRVEDTTFSDLCKLRLKKSSEQVPSLSEVLMAMGSREDIFVEIEMKAGPSEFYTPYVLEDYCRRLNDMTKVLMKPGTYAFTCFNEKTLATMRKVDPDAPLGFIVGGPLEDAHIAKAKELGCCSVDQGDGGEGAQGGADGLPVDVPGQGDMGRVCGSWRRPRHYRLPSQAHPRGGIRTFAPPPTSPRRPMARGALVRLQGRDGSHTSDNEPSLVCRASAHITGCVRKSLLRLRPSACLTRDHRLGLAQRPESRLAHESTFAGPA